jgi:hypothetical protein
MTGIRVPEKAARWASMQSMEFGPGEMAAALGISHRSALLYLSRLETKGLISKLMRGRYVSALPTPSKKALNIARLLAHEMPLTRVVVWGTDSLAPFSHHMLPRPVIFVETEAEDAPSAGDVLREKGYKVVLEPTAKEYRSSVELGVEVFVRNARSRWGAIPWKKNVSLAILEKMFVDLYFLVTRKGFPLPRVEVAKALRAAIGQKAVRPETVRRYAIRRNVYPELREYVEG